jgi:hypothetical protein
MKPWIQFLLDEGLLTTGVVASPSIVSGSVVGSTLTLTKSDASTIAVDVSGISGASGVAGFTFSAATGSLDITKENGLVSSVVFADTVGATALVAGTKGLVPAPSAGDEFKFLKGDGTWGTVATTFNDVLASGTALTADRTIDAGSNNLAITNLPTHTNANDVDTHLMLDSSSQIKAKTNDSIRGVLTGTAVPSGSNTAYYLGQLYFRSTDSTWYKATTASTSPIDSAAGSVWTLIPPLPKYYWVDESQLIANVRYYSYLLDNASGYWWIRKEDTSSGSLVSSFSKGTSNYATNWTNRTSLTYSQLTTPDGSFF